MTRPTCEDTYLTGKRNLNNGYYSLTFAPYSRAAVCRPGQFVHIRLPGTDVFFRRAYSVASAEDGRLEILLKVMGRGSSLLAELRKGDAVNLLGPLGTPFRLPRKNETVLLVAGGIGFPPLLYLAYEMIKRGHSPKKIEFFFGGKSASDIIERARIRKLGVNFHPVTEDGSLGEAGLVTELVEKCLKNSDTKKLRMYVCGPEGLLKAANELGLKYSIPGQLSVETPMPCGIGICLGCVVALSKGGYARACCEGPVFDIGEVVL
jgi:dihydroorotate dehydrogenase electron transfer subunit